MVNTIIVESWRNSAQLVMYYRESGKLSMKDFVPADGVIPQASIIDYALVSQHRSK